MTNPNGFNNLGRGSPKEHFCKIILKSVQWLWTSRFLKVFYIDYIGKINPAPWRPCFLTNPNVLNNLGRGSPKKHFCKIILKSVQWFRTRRFLKVFYIDYIGKISPAPWRPCFLTNPNVLNNLGRGSPKEHFCKIILKSVQWFRTRRFLKVFYIDYIGKISPAPWRPCFLTNPNGLNNLGRGSPKEHFCKIILKSVQWFRTRRFLKFSI